MEKFDNVIQCWRSRIYMLIAQRDYVHMDKQIAKNVAASMTKEKDLIDKGMACYDSEISL